MIEFFYIIHYIVYRYYRKHLESQFFSMLRASCIHGIFFCSFILEIDYFISLIFNVQELINDTTSYILPIFWTLLEYKVFYRHEKYKDIFVEYDCRRETPKMKTKCKIAKIFNFCILAIDLLFLIIMDYINHGCSFSYALSYFR